MSRSVPDFLTAECQSVLHRSACRSCSRRKDCPYSCDRVLERCLLRAALQGKTAAQSLTAEAGRLRENISGADSVCNLLCADEAMERVLSDVLHRELSLLAALSGGVQQGV